MPRKSHAQVLSDLRESLLSEAGEHGPVSKLVLIPDSVNKEFVGRVVSPSAEYRSVVASRYKGLIVGETVYFVVPMAKATA
jgi:hypothetical protein